MFSWMDKVPGYLLGKYQMIMTVTFTALFSLVLLMASIPFSRNPWFQLDTSVAIGYTVCFFCVALAVVAVSKIMMYSWRTKYMMIYAQYLSWNAAEILIVCSLYTFATVEASSYGLIDLGGMGTGTLFFNSLLYLIASMAFPYILTGMYFAIQDKDNTIRMINYANVVSDETLEPHQENKITLFDNNGVLKLSVSASNLYFIESDDNYVKVWYTDSKGLLKQYMLRCRLKTIEDSFRGSDLVRCHRKYVVNVSKIKVLSREKDGYVLDLGLEGIDSIPVTKTYEDQVLDRFNSR